MRYVFTVNPIFGDGMVLQRDTEITVWGQGEENTIIEIEFCNQYKLGIVKNGEWIVKLDPISYGGPFEMIIKFNNQEKRIKDILIGDVFLAAGQSNIQFMLKESLEGNVEIQGSNNENIRYFDVPRVQYEDENLRIPDLKPGKWLKCNSENSGDFSAIAYYFAKNIQVNIGIPIGIIGCNFGGTSAACWMSEEYLSKNSKIKKLYLDSYYNEISNLTNESEERRDKEYLKKLEEHNVKVEDYKRNFPGKSIEEMNVTIGDTPWPPPISRKSALRPCGLYKTMLAKINNYKIKAVIWYQGEEDTKESLIYEDLLKLLIENWRVDRCDNNLPFIVVQLPAYCDNKAEDSWPQLRQAQFNVSKKINNVELVVSLDCGEKFNIHPIEKRTIAERMALTVREKIYKQDVESCPPEVKEITVNDNKVIMTFKNLYGDSIFIKGDHVIQQFEISEDGVEFKKPIVQINNDKITAYSPTIKNPKVIRYAWKNYVQVNIYNKNKLPLSTFKIDIQ